MLFAPIQIVPIHHITPVIDVNYSFLADDNYFPYQQH